jgi:hypothetical protein
MAERHLVLCGRTSAKKLGRDWQSAPVVRLRLGEGRNDVHLRLEHLSQRLCANLPGVAVDLLEIAAYVYAADQAVTRGGRVEIEYGRRWRRHFRFEIPVRCLDIWRRADVHAALTEALSFLSDDDYEFNFTRLRTPPPLSRYLFDVLESEQDFEEVILFSGGLDSLGGAVREILQGHHKVVLVSHRPNAKILSGQRELVACLNDRVTFSGYRPLHVAVEVNKGKRLGKDFTQRTRSFLFAAVAAVVAGVFGQTRIRFYENGPISLNLPVSPQVLGGRASRTTHPRVLKGFERLLESLLSKKIHVQNPFLWSTKAEILMQIRGAGCGELCALTSSCTHTWTQTSSGPHCGRCSQCVDRRLAALSAGLSDKEDPPNYYRSHVLLGPIDGADLILAERYVGSLLQAEGISSPAAFITRFPEVTRALPHVDESTARAAELAHDLYLRHAKAVQAALIEAVRRHPECVVRRDCPINSLLGIVSGRSSWRPARTETGSACSAADRCSCSPNVLLLDRETFEARFGNRKCFLGNTREFWLLDRLNRRPGFFVSYDTLRADVWRDERTAKNTIQRTVCNLRRRLKSDQFESVIIDGSEPDHYQLVLPV